MSKDEEETVYLFLKKEWQRCTNNCKIWCRWNGLKNVRLMVPEPLTLYRPLWDPLSRPVPSPALATGYPRYHEASNVFFKLVISWSRDGKFCQSGSPHRIQRNDLTFKKWKEQEKKIENVLKSIYICCIRNGLFTGWWRWWFAVSKKPRCTSNYSFTTLANFVFLNLSWYRRNGQISFSNQQRV